MWCGVVWCFFRLASFVTTRAARRAAQEKREPLPKGGLRLVRKGRPIGWWPPIVPTTSGEPRIWHCFAGRNGSRLARRGHVEKTGSAPVLYPCCGTNVAPSQSLACGRLFEGPAPRTLSQHFCGGFGEAAGLGKPRLSASGVGDHGFLLVYPGRPRRMPRAVATGPRGVRVHWLGRRLNKVLRSVL